MMLALTNAAAIGYHDVEGSAKALAALGCKPDE